MYFDLYHPFPLVEDSDEGTSKKSKKGKGKAVSQPQNSDPTSGGNKVDCWQGLDSPEKDKFSKRIALAGHLGYSVVGCTISPSGPSSNVVPSPFTRSLPFPHIDPRFPGDAGPSSTSASTSNADRPAMVQVSRYHIQMADNKAHPLTNQSTNALRAYDIISVAPLTDKAFHLACTDMSNPGPNQISIITLPLHERPFTFRFNRKQMRQAQRNGVVFELLYSAALFPSPSLPPDIARRYRQNFLSNAREVVRITGGKGVILSSGPGGSDIGLRGPMDLVNLGTMLGMPANLAKEAVEKAPKMVLLRAQARRTFKAIMSMPKLVPPSSPEEHVEKQARERQDDESTEFTDQATLKRAAEEGVLENGKVKKVKKVKA